MKIKDLKEWVLICLDGKVPTTLVSKTNNKFIKEYEDVIDFMLDENVDDLEIDDTTYQTVKITNRQIVIWLK